MTTVHARFAEAAAHIVAEEGLLGYFQCAGTNLISWNYEREVPSDAEITAALAVIDAAAIRTAREAAYRAESDPIFFKAQRGEATNDEWLAKIEEIKTRFPYA